MKLFQGRRCAVWVLGEKDICDHCICINIHVGGEENTPLVQEGEPEDFLTQIPLEGHWGEDLLDVFLYILLLICWFLTKNCLCHVL